jgi:putative inorganic carbon (HCO3(-)) transporter
LSGVLAGVGVLVAAGASGAAILLPPGRPRSVAMLVAIGLFPVLILGDQWHSTQIADLRHHSERLVALAVAGLVATGILAAVFRRRPVALPLAIVAALPFRIPLHAGGDTANLLVPLYLVIAGGVVAAALRDWAGRPAGPVGGVGGLPWAARCSGRRDDAPEDSGPRPPQPPPGGRPPTPPPPARGAAKWLPRVLAAVVVLYALQTLYSPDFSKGLQNVCFFFVPFSLVYALLRDVAWDRKLLAGILVVITVEAVAFVLVGSVEYLSRSLSWNDQVIRSNEFHTYFRVNSVFWDPNIYGRYLALVIVVAMAALLWAKERRSIALLTTLVAALWIGLVPTFSQSSFAALLAGLAVLAALRWSLRWTLATVGVGAIVAILFVGLVGGSSKVNFSRLNIDTSGRANLVSGGIHLFAQRPVYGYGSGAFPTAYREHVATHKAPVSVSHTEPITVAAEQGVVGLALYAALIVVALWAMTTGLRSLMPAPTPPARLLVGRAAVLAAFIALLVHTMAYAGFFEDPIAWVLLAVGASLATAAQVRPAT